MAKTAILSVRILGDAKNAVSAMGEVEGKSSRLGGMMKGVAGVVAGAAVAGGAALAGLGVSGVKAAGDLEQSIGAVDSVFKGSSDQVHAFADSAATDLGLTGNEYRELATLMGTQLKNGGTSMDELAGKTNDLMGLGADLSSMFGGSTVDAVSAISSALKGERDPIEAYGVSLKQASIDAKAAELGFTKVGGSLSDEAQQAATLALIMEQTADAHGNFGRETGTFAGQVSILTAQWGNFTAQVGMLLLPILTTLLTFVTGTVMPGLQGLADVIGPHITAAIDTVMPMLESLVSGFGGVAGGGSLLQTIVGAVGFAFSTIAPAVQSFLPALIGFGQTVIPTIIAAVQGLIPVIMHIASVAVPAILGLVQRLLPIAQNIIGAVIPAIVGAVRTLVPVIMGLIPPIMSIVGTVLDILGPAIDWLLPLVVGIFGAIVTQVQGAIQIVTGVLTTVAALLRGDWSGAWRGVQQIVQGVMTMVRGVIQQSMAWISRFTGQSVGRVRSTFVNGFTMIRSRVTGAVSGLVSGVTRFIGNLLSSIRARVNSIRSTITGGFNAARSIAIRAFVGLVSGVTGRIGSLLSTIRQLPGRIRSGLGSLGSLLRSAGRDLIQGLINGVGSMGSALRNKASNLAGGAVNAIKSKLGIASPSRVMMQIGRWTGEGFVNGIDRMQSAASGAMSGLVEVPAVPSIPLAGSTGGAGAGVTINEGDVHVHVSGVIDDRLARKIEDAIVRAKQRTGAAAGSRLRAGV